MNRLLLQICLFLLSTQALATDTPQAQIPIETLASRMRNVSTSPEVIAAADSLFAAATHSKQPEYQCKALIAKANYYSITGDTLIDKTVALGRRIADTHKLNTLYFNVWQYLINSHIRQQRYLVVMRELDDYKTESLKRESREGRAYLHTLLGDLFYSQLRYSSACFDYRKSDSLCRELQLPTLRIYNNYMLGICSREEQKYDASLEYMRKAYNLARDDAKRNPQQYALKIELELGLCYRDVGKIDSMQMCYTCFDPNKVILNDSERSTYHQLEAYVMLDRGDYTQALAAADSISSPLVSDRIKESIYLAQNDYRNAYLALQRSSTITKEIRKKSNAIRSAELIEMTTIAQRAIGNQMQRQRTMMIWIAILALALFAGFIIYFISRLRYLKRLEQQTEIAERAKANALRADRLKNDFIDGLCNEVTTPLNSIVGFSQVIGSDDVSQEERDTFSKIIYNNSERLKSLVNDILDLSKLTRASYKVTLMEVNASDICMMAIAKVRNNLPNGISVNFKGDINHPNITLNTDIKRVRQVIESYMHVAATYSDQESITLSYKVDEKMQTISYSVTCHSTIAPTENINQLLRGEVFDAEGNHIMSLNICRTIAEYLYASCYVDMSYTQGLRMVFTVPIGHN